MLAGLRFEARATPTTWPITFAPAWMVDPSGRGTFCMTRAVMIWPGALFAEDRLAFKRTGSTVPAGSEFAAQSPAANVRQKIEAKNAECLKVQRMGFTSFITMLLKSAPT